MSAVPAVVPVAVPEDGVGAKVVAVGLWIVGLLWLIPMLSGMAILSIFVRPDATDWLNRLYCRGQLFLTGCRWRAEVDPAVDPDAVYLFAQNHTNHFDHVVLYNATGHFKQGLELEEHFKIPFYGWFMKARGTIPVRRGSQGQTPEILAYMREELGRKHSILAFPEGTRTTTGRIGKLRRGVFFIARDLGIPIVPVAVTGMYDTMRKGSWLIRPGYEVVVHVCAPIPTEGVDDDGIDALVAETHRVLSEKVDAYWISRGR